MVVFLFDKDTSLIFLICQMLITAVALFLTGLSIRAWKNTKLNKIIYVIIAFILFAVIHIFNYIDQGVVDIVSDDTRYVIFAISEIGIMSMFVMAIIKK